VPLLRPFQAAADPHGATANDFPELEGSIFESEPSGRENLQSPEIDEDESSGSSRDEQCEDLGAAPHMEG
jgi:hypothetical protein